MVHPGRDVQATRWYTTTPTYGSKVLERGSEDYERCRRMAPSADVAKRFPREIHIVESTEDITKALTRAVDLKTHIAVRASGHVMHAPNLVDDGIMIDTVNLYRRVEYDHITKEINFGPACRVEEL